MAEVNHGNWFGQVKNQQKLLTTNTRSSPTVEAPEWKKYNTEQVQATYRPAEPETRS